MIGSNLKLLDHGSAELMRVDGCDADIASAARTSTGNSGDPVKDAKLIDRLLRDAHWSPFEQVGLQFRLKLPIFVMRQLVRHRVIALNEYSARYAEVEDCYYVPTLNRMQGQSTFNKQGSAETLEAELTAFAEREIRDVSDHCYHSYRSLLGAGLTRELARIVLPVNFYTVIVARVSLRGLFQFLELRLDPHAQYEIRVYADALLEFARGAFPIATASFERHIVGGRRVSKEALRELIAGSEHGPEAAQLSREFGQC